MSMFDEVLNAQASLPKLPFLLPDTSGILTISQVKHFASAKDGKKQFVIEFVVKSMKGSKPGATPYEPGTQVCNIFQYQKYAPALRGAKSFFLAAVGKSEASVKREELAAILEQAGDPKIQILRGVDIAFNMATQGKKKDGTASTTQFPTFTHVPGQNKDTIAAARKALDLSVPLAA